MPRFFIFGDSHSGTIMRAARSLGVDFAGGSVIGGRHMVDAFFRAKNGRFIMTDETAAERLNIRLAESGMGENFLDVDLPILSTVGFNTTHFANAFLATDLSISELPGKRLISRACFRAVVEASRAGALEFYRLLIREKKTVFAVLSPRRFSQQNFAICQAFDETLAGLVGAMGVNVIDVGAETSDSDGLLRPEFASAIDHVHGNDAFGEVVLRRLAKMMAA